jgi:hypothetical protein
VDKFDYSRSKDTAYRLINRFGQELTFTREVGEAYDPSTGTVSTTTESYSADAVWLNYRNDEIDDSIVLQGDARVLVAASVEVDDRVTFEGDEWRVVIARPLNPAGIELYTEAQVRN